MYSNIVCFHLFIFSIVIRIMEPFFQNQKNPGPIEVDFITIFQLNWCRLKIVELKKKTVGTLVMHLLLQTFMMA